MSICKKFFTLVINNKITIYNHDNHVGDFTREEFDEFVSNLIKAKQDFNLSNLDNVD